MLIVQLSTNFNANEAAQSKYNHNFPGVDRLNVHVTLGANDALKHLDNNSIYKRPIDIYTNCG